MKKHVNSGFHGFSPDFPGLPWTSMNFQQRCPWNQSIREAIGVMDADAAQVVDGMVNLGELKTGTAGVLGGWMFLGTCMMIRYIDVYCTIE